METAIEKLQFWRSARRAGRTARHLTSRLASLVRGSSGSRVGRLGARPEKRLVLFEMENCPYSRKAREALSILDLDADIRPCPEGSRVHRKELVDVGGKEQVPLLLDPNTMAVVYDSDEIIDYLFEHYGTGKPPLALRARSLTTLSSKLASELRGGHRGTRAEPARRPELPLELWSHEACPDSRLVRETLGRYELPYVLRNVARGSQKTSELEKVAGRVHMPHLVDPNRDVSLNGAGNINAYLRDTYGRRMPSVAPEPLVKRRAAST